MGEGGRSPRLDRQVEGCESGQTDLVDTTNGNDYTVVMSDLCNQEKGQISDMLRQMSLNPDELSRKKQLQQLEEDMVSDLLAQIEQEEAEVHHLRNQGAAVREKLRTIRNHAKSAAGAESQKKKQAKAAFLLKQQEGFQRDLQLQRQQILTRHYHTYTARVSKIREMMKNQIQMRSIERNQKLEQVNLKNEQQMHDVRQLCAQRMVEKEQKVEQNLQLIEMEKQKIVEGQKRKLTVKQEAAARKRVLFHQEVASKQAGVVNKRRHLQNKLLKWKEDNESKWNQTVVVKRQRRLETYEHKQLLDKEKRDRLEKQLVEREQKAQVRIDAMRQAQSQWYRNKGQEAVARLKKNTTHRTCAEAEQLKLIAEEARQKEQKCHYNLRRLQVKKDSDFTNKKTSLETNRIMNNRNTLLRRLKDVQSRKHKLASQVDGHKLLLETISRPISSISMAAAKTSNTCPSQRPHSTPPAFPARPPARPNTARPNYSNASRVNRSARPTSSRPTRSRLTSSARGSQGSNPGAWISRSFSPGPDTSYGEQTADSASNTYNNADGPSDDAREDARAHSEVSSGDKVPEEQMLRKDTATELTRLGESGFDKKKQKTKGKRSKKEQKRAKQAQAPAEQIRNTEDDVD